MQIVSRELGKAAAIFQTDEVRPMDGAYLPDFVSAVAQRYRFASSPENPTIQDILKFENGSIKLGNEKVSIRNLIIYSDAVVTETSHTSLSLETIEDFNGFSILSFGYRAPKTPPLYVFESHLVIDFESKFNNAMKAFGVFSRAIQAQLEDVYQRSFPVDLAMVGLASDPTQLPALTANYLKPEFSITRRLNRPYVDNRCFCSATLPTDPHIKLLEDFEREVLMAE